MGNLHADIEPSPPTHAMVRVIHLPATHQAPGLARRFIREVTTDWGLYALPSPVRGLSLYDVIVECVSEIVTNSVDHVPWRTIPHGETPISMSVRRASGLLSVLVQDASDVLPKAAPLPNPEDKAALLERESGNGLCIVNHFMAECDGRFDTHRLVGAGKIVSFDMPMRSEKHDHMTA